MCFLKSKAKKLLNVLMCRNIPTAGLSSLELPKYILYIFIVRIDVYLKKSSLQ